MPSLLDVIETKVKFQLSIPESLYDHYERQAKRNGRTAEEEMAERIKRCRAFTANKPLYMNDDERAEVERLTGHTIRNADSFIGRLRAMFTVHVDAIEIEVPSNLRARMLSRVFRGQTYKGNLQRIVVDAIERYCGMRP